MVTCGGCALCHAGREHVGKDDVDVDAGAQDIMFRCESEETELCHASHTLDGNSFEEEIGRHGDMWCLRSSASGGAHVGKDDLDAGAGGPRHHVGARGCGDGNSF